jgi:hypothetical protein
VHRKYIPIYIQQDATLDSLLTFICLRRLHYRRTLRTIPSDRDVRTRLTGFRVDLGTRYVTVCVLQEGVGGSF